MKTTLHRLLLVLFAIAVLFAFYVLACTAVYGYHDPSVAAQITADNPWAVLLTRPLP